MKPENSSPRPAAALWRKLVWGGAAGAMLTAGVASLTLPGMVWDAFDFAVFGAMLLTGALAFELALRLGAADPRARLAACLAIGGAFVMVMANLAVGIIGNEENPVNLLFFALLAAGAAGAAAVRLRAAGMTRVMAALAAGQGLLGTGLALAGLGSTPVFTLFYVLLWLGAAALFRKAAMHERQWTT